MFFGMTTRRVLAVVCAGVLSLSAANAATQNPGVYDVSSVNTGGNDHTLWLPGLFGDGSNYWQFVDGDGAFVVTEDGASLDAIAQRNGDDLQVRVQLEMTHTEMGSSIKCYTTSCDTSDWDFFDYISGTITGVSDALTGLILDMSATGPVAQLGTGANDKSGVFGFSSWFTLAVSNDNTYSGPLYLPHHGDLNLELTPVPLPAAGWMLIAGIAGLFGLRRRQQAA